MKGTWQERKQRAGRGYCTNCRRRLSKRSTLRCRTCLESGRASAIRWGNRSDAQAIACVASRLQMRSAIVRSVWAGRYSQCALCGTPAQETKRGKLYFDHNHQTGTFRGWLCARCNGLVGYIETCQELIPLVESYLTQKKEMNIACTG